MEDLMEIVLMEKTENYIPPAHWNFLTPFYDIGCILLGFGKGFRHRIIKHLNLSGTERILDAGCGTGTLLIMLKEIYPSVVAEGLDPDEKALQIAYKKTQKNNFNIPLHRGAMNNMHFENSSFNVVLSSLVFHHLQKDNRLASLKECLRVLKPGGRMLLIDFGPPRPYIVDRILSRLFSLFEPIEDGVEGRIPELILEVGFNKVNEIGKYLYGITFYESYKQDEKGGES